MKLENLDLGVVLEEVGREKNIDKSVLISALEDAMLSAARKKLGLESDLEARYNESIGEVEVYEFRRIIPDDVIAKAGEINFEEAKKLDPALSKEAIGEDLGVKLDSKEFGRIAAQNAKQIIVQRVRDAERLVVYNEYKDRKDELVAGTVRRFERGDVILDLGRAEAVIPHSEQVPKENIRIHERVVAYVADVLESARGSQIILSRSHPNLVVKLFEQEVPEIAEGIVTIESVAREPGFRSKISVRSKDPDVDPVGACVGMKGSRVQAVVQELRGEKIDIVPFDEDEARLVCNALAPAEVARVLINEESHNMQIVVPDEQLSLAIGRRGQNVRLASQLTGWKIDIQPESKAIAEREEAWVNMSQVKSLSELQFQTLFNYGVRNLNQLIVMSPDVLSGMPGFENEDLKTVLSEANIVLKEASNKRQEILKNQRKEAEKLLKLYDLALSLTKEGNEREIGLEIVGIESKEKLESAGYLDLIDIILDKDVHHLMKAAKLDEDTAAMIMSIAQKKLGEQIHNA